MVVARQQRQPDPPLTMAATTTDGSESGDGDEEVESRGRGGHPTRSPRREPRSRGPKHPPPSSVTAMRVRGLPMRRWVVVAAAFALAFNASSCHAGKDKVTTSEPTAGLVPPPVSSPPAYVPIPADGAGGDPQQQGPGGSGAGTGPNAGGAGGGGGAPMADDYYADDDKGNNKDDDKRDDDDKGPGGGGGGANSFPTWAPAPALTPPSGPTAGSTTTTYSVALPLMELDLSLATTGGGGGGSTRRQRRTHVGRPRHPQTSRMLASNGTSTTTLDADALGAALEEFWATFLERSHRDTLQYVRLDAAVQSYDPQEGYARVSASNGRAAFKGEQVKAADLADTIATYLSFWGVQDLMAALHDQAGLNVLALNVSLDGVPVQPQVQVVDPGGGGTTSGNSSGTGGDPSPSASSSSSSASKSNSTLIVVIAVLGTLAVLLLAGTMWIVMKRRNSRGQVNKHLGGIASDDDVDFRNNDGDDDTQSYSPRLSSSRASPSRFRILGTASAGSQSNLSTPNASPNRLSRALSDDFRSLSGVVSVEDSIFTTTDGAAAAVVTTRSVGGDVVVVREPSSSNSYLQYDPSRLDQVILSAKGRTGQAPGADP